jgi:hypothetical protein
MPISIIDPEIQSRLAQDYAENRVPTFNPNDATQAQEFVDYWNNLLGFGEAEIKPVVLVPKTTYTVEFLTIENRKQ